MADSDRIARVAKGKRPAYFRDPAVDKLHAIVMTLVAELSVTRDRLDALERLLEQRGHLAQADLDDFKPDEAGEVARRSRREAYIQRVMRVVEMEIDEVGKRRDGETFDRMFARLVADE